MKIAIVKIVVIAAISSLLMGCSGRVVSSDWQSVDRTGWNQDSVLRLHYSVPDTTATYRMLLYVRHTDMYPYQNMWLFLDNDTLEFYLADDRGMWLGNGKNGLIEMPILLEDGVQITGGDHTVSVRHGMRQESLRGVSDVGIVIEKTE